MERNGFLATNGLYQQTLNYDCYLEYGYVRWNEWMDGWMELHLLAGYTHGLTISLFSPWHAGCWALGLCWMTGAMGIVNRHLSLFF